MKDFNEWNKQKIEINKNSLNKWVKIREVWWMSLGINIGSEENGKGDKVLRPVIILKVFGKNTCVVVPLTSVTKVGVFYHTVGVVSEDGIISTALLSQIKVLDTKRCFERIGKIEPSVFLEMKKAIAVLLL